jgi:hypothetical protein
MLPNFKDKFLNAFPKMKEMFFLFERKPSKELKHGINVSVFLSICI